MSGTGEQKELARKLAWAVCSTLVGTNRDVRRRVALWAWWLAGRIIDAKEQFPVENFYQTGTALLDKHPSDRYNQRAVGREKSPRVAATLAQSRPGVLLPFTEDVAQKRRTYGITDTSGPG